MSEPATIAAVAAAVTAATTVGTAASGAFSPGGGDLPDFTGIAKAQQAAQQTGALKGQVRPSITEAAGRGLGGASPDFLANLTASQAGAPGGGTEALDLVQQYLRGGFV